MKENKKALSFLLFVVREMQKKCYLFSVSNLKKIKIFFLFVNEIKI